MANQTISAIQFVSEITVLAIVLCMCGCEPFQNAELDHCPSPALVALGDLRGPSLSSLAEVERLAAPHEPAVDLIILRVNS